MWNQTCLLTVWLWRSSHGHCGVAEWTANPFPHYHFVVIGSRKKKKCHKRRIALSQDVLGLKILKA